MKRKLASLSLTMAVLASTLMGCSTDTQSTGTTAATGTTAVAETTTKAPAEEVSSGDAEKILVWTANRHDMEYMNEKVAEFNEEYKGKIEVEFVINSDNYINMLTMALTSNQAPDLFCVGGATSGFDLKSFVESGFLQPVNQYMTEEYKALYNLESLSYPNINSYNGELYWVPTTQRSGMRLIYNKRIMDAAGYTEGPKTYAELVEMAKVVTENGGGTEFGFAAPGLSAPQARFMVPIAEVSGVSPYDYVNGKFDFSGYEPVIELTRQMFTDESMLPGTANLKIDPQRVQFSEGNVGMYGNASQEVGVLIDQFPTKDDWGVWDMPSIDGTIQGALTAQPQNGWAITSSCKNPEAAWTVAEYFSSEELMIGYVEGGFGLATSVPVMEQADEEAMGKLAEFGVREYESVYPKFPIVAVSGKGWEEVIWETTMNTNNIAEVLQKLSDDYNEAYDKEIKIGKAQRLVIKDYNPLTPGAGTQEYLTQ